MSDTTAYVVLARKYRPQTFDEIVGQEPVTRTLKNALSQGRVHHAYLFCGSRGVGKTTTARVLAKALNCEKGPTPSPCGTCLACEEIRTGTAIDVLEIDGASNNSVDNVRELCENARYLPARGKRKVYVIDEVHMLSQSAFNALLKTLEEPPPHVSFIFATTEAHRIPATILSRCQRFDFRRLSDSQLRQHLSSIATREQLQIDDSALGLLARAAEGSVRDALSLLDQVIAYTGGQELSSERIGEILGVADRQSLVTLVDAICARDGDRALGVIHQVFRSGYDLGRFSQALLGHLRDLVVAASVAQPEALLDMADAERRDVIRQAKGIDRTRLLAFCERFAASSDAVARAQNPKVVLEIAILDLFDAEPLVPLGDLIDRLVALENRLTGDRATAPHPAAPAAVAPPASAKPFTSSTSSWPELVLALERQKANLAGIFALGKPLRVAPDEIVIGFAQDSFPLQQARDRLADFSQFVASTWGRAVQVRIEAVAAEAPAPPSLAEMEQAKRSSERERLQKEALEHPAVRAALDVLGGQVREVKA